jgi:hypothetical protein
MRTDNPFDRKLELRKGKAESITTSAILVNDTLELCWASAQSVFEEKATPEHALAIFDRVMNPAIHKAAARLVK